MCYLKYNITYVVSVKSGYSCRVGPLYEMLCQDGFGKAVVSANRVADRHPHKKR